mmetsp:Transcript_15438/g.31003  ORF Transcript_15438/g.31003 Transcript_15438/m.31003 type:complete len:206 (+) Transcript_15438:1285-1902(+)
MKVHLEVGDSEVRLHHNALHLVPAREDNKAVSRAQLLRTRDRNHALPAIRRRAVAVGERTDDHSPVLLELVVHLLPVLWTHCIDVLTVVEGLLDYGVLFDRLLGEEEHGLVLDRYVDFVVRQQGETGVGELLAVRFKEEGFEGRNWRRSVEPLLRNRHLGLEAVLSLLVLVVTNILHVERRRANLVHARRHHDLLLREAGLLTAV